MTASRPPSAAAWLLEHLGGENEALAGDLLEEFRRGRSAAWYWRQVLVAIVVSQSKALWLTVGVVALYWIGHYIPISGANTDALAALARGPLGSIFKYNLFTGGNLAPVTIFALGVMPYVTASICVLALALLSSLIRGTAARLAPWRVRQYTWVVAMVLCMVQAYGIALFLERQAQSVAGLRLVYNPGWVFRLTTVTTLTSGTAGLMWLSDYITARGSGNGMFLTVLAGVLVGLPSAASLLSQLWRVGLDSSIILASARIVVGVGVVAVTSHFYRRAIQSEQLF